MTEQTSAWCLLDPDPAGPAQTAALADRAAQAASRWADRLHVNPPRRIDPLPEDITLAEAESVRVGIRPPGDAICTAAVGGDQLEPVDLDLVDLGPGFLVAGPPRSGRSTALAAIVRSLSGRGTGERPVAILAPRPSPLRAMEGLGGVLAVYTEADHLADELPALIEELARPLAIVIDDAELVSDSRAAAALERLVRMARDRDIVVVAGATTDDVIQSRFRGWLSDVRRSKSGLLLCPSSSYDGEAFDIKLPRSVGGGWPPGRALLVSRGRAAAVQVVQVQ